jgi:YD repeat-containing protein
MATFTYDVLHRPLTTVYNDGVTPGVTYAYDAGGHLKSITSAVGSTTYSTVTYNNYDALGRFATNTQKIIGNPTTYAFRYTYALNDEWRTLRYPSGRFVNYSLADDGRITKVSGGNTTYADLTVPLTPYTADGRIAQMQLGNGLWETRDYRTPGTPTLLKLGTTAGANDRLQLDYNYSDTNNNGNLLSQVVRRDGAFWKQDYTYDGLNRLGGVTEWNKNTLGPNVGWAQTYGYDRFGNRWVPTSSIQNVDTHEPTFETNFDTMTNRRSGLVYDAAGNLLQYAPYTLTYDAENRLVSMTGPSNVTGTFTYDGLGRRVKKSWTSGGTTTTTYYTYDATGRLAAEYSTATPGTPTTSYVFTDLLGSVRALSGSTASLTECDD